MHLIHHKFEREREGLNIKGKEREEEIFLPSSTFFLFLFLLPLAPSLNYTTRLTPSGKTPVASSDMDGQVSRPARGVHLDHEAPEGFELLGDVCCGLLELDVALEHRVKVALLGNLL